MGLLVLDGRDVLGHLQVPFTPGEAGIVVGAGVGRELPLRGERGGFSSQRPAVDEVVPVEKGLRVVEEEDRPEPQTAGQAAAKPDLREPLEDHVVDPRRDRLDDRLGAFGLEPAVEAVRAVSFGRHRPELADDRHPRLHARVVDANAREDRPGFAEGVPERTPVAERLACEPLAFGERPVGVAGVRLVRSDLVSEIVQEVARDDGADEKDEELPVENESGLFPRLREPFVLLEEDDAEAGKSGIREPFDTRLRTCRSGRAAPPAVRKDVPVLDVRFARRAEPFQVLDQVPHRVIGGIAHPRLPNSFPTASDSLSGQGSGSRRYPSRSMAIRTISSWASVRPPKRIVVVGR